MRHLLLLPCLVLAPDPRSELTTYIPMEISAPSGDKAANIKVMSHLISHFHDDHACPSQVYIPSRGQLSLASGDEVYESVLGSWTSVVSAHQAGLSEPGQPPGPDLSPGEAWHHYQAGQAGVVDSARLLITFSLVTSVQAGGEPLHTAASLGDVERVRRLLEAGARVDSVKDDGNTALHCAAIMGHNNVVELLVEEEADLEATGNSGATPLMMAASMGHLEVVKTLLQSGANPDTRHQFGKTTAIHFAAEVGRDEIVKLLCDHGANVEAEKVTGGTALHTAVDANMSDTVTVLVEHCGAGVDRLLMGDTTPLYLAAQRGHTEVARQLLRLGARVNFVMPHGQHRGEMIQVSGEQTEGFYPVKNTEVGNGATPLHAAVENGHLETARLLLEAGAAQSDSMEGATPLIIALQYRHPAIAMLLLEEASGDPKINAKVPVDGSSALFVASLYGYGEVVSRLLQRSVKVNIKNMRGQTPLSAAISSNNLDIVNMLLEAGATLADEKTKQDLSPLQSAVLTKSVTIVRNILSKLPDLKSIEEAVNSPGPDRQTALHLSLNGPLDIVQLLLDHGAELDARVGSTLATPLHMAALRGRAEVVALLLSRGCLTQPRAGESLYGATPLYLAAQTGDLETVRLLLEAGADANCVLRRMGVSPLFIASERGHTEVARLLLRHGASVRLRNWNGVTSLGVAALSGNAKIVKSLIDAGQLNPISLHTT